MVSVVVEVDVVFSVVVVETESKAACICIPNQ